MSDIEKNELNNAESENTNSTEQEQTHELEQELEQIKELFQQELDNASSDNSQQENHEELIQHLDEFKEENEENEDSTPLPMCECCEENHCSTQHGEGYPYCDSCRSLMVKYPIRFSGIVALLVTIVMIIGGFWLSQDEIVDASLVLEASMPYASGHMTTAATAYQSYFSSSESENFSRRAVREAVKSYMALGATTDIVNLVDKYYSEDDLKKFYNKNLKEIYDFCTKINYTTETVYESMVYPAVYGYTPIQDAIDSINEFIDEVTKNQAAVATSTDAQSDWQKYDLIIAEYYIYYLMANGDYDNDTRFMQMKSIASAAEQSGNNYRWMYAPAMAMIAAETGDLDIVNECRQHIIENNRDDVSAYTSLAHYYLKLEKPDTDKVIQACKEADEAFPSGEEVSHYRYYAAAYLLAGDSEEAFKKMESYTAQGIRYVSDANLYALCAIATNNTQVYTEMVDTLSNAGYEISEYVEKYKAGKITIEKIFEISGGDFI